MPNSITFIGGFSMHDSKVTTINYAGTKAQWNSIKKETGWNVHDQSSSFKLNCKDGLINVPLITYVQLQNGAS